MGRKKKKPPKPWCWYCNREFDDEKILIQHQKARHFKCPLCHKKLFTAPGLANHCLEVHKDALVTVPNALRHRNNINIEIYGMEGIPEDDCIRHERRKKEAAAAGIFNMDRDYRIDDKSNSYGWEPQDFLHRDREAEYYDRRQQDGNFPERRQLFMTDETASLYNSESRGRLYRNNPDALDMHFSPSRLFEQSDVFERRRDDMTAVEKEVDLGRYTERRDFLGEKCNFSTENFENDRYGRRFNERELSPQSGFPFKSEPARNSPNDRSRPHLLEFPMDSQNPSPRPHLLEFPTDSQNPSPRPHLLEFPTDSQNPLPRPHLLEFPTDSQNPLPRPHLLEFPADSQNPLPRPHLLEFPADSQNPLPRPHLLEFPTDSQNPSTSKHVFERQRDDMIAVEKKVDHGRYAEQQDFFGEKSNFPTKNFENDRYGRTSNERELNPQSRFPFKSEPARNLPNDRSRPHLLGFPMDSQNPSTSKRSSSGNMTPTMSSKVFGGSSTSFEKFSTADTGRLFGQTAYRGANRFSATEATSNPQTNRRERIRATVTPSKASISDIHDESLEKIWDAVSRAVSMDNKAASNSEETSHLICCICSVREREVALQPCGHFVSCRKCTKYIKNCPICRKPVNDVLRIYTS